jgi:hypothetical protein
VSSFRPQADTKKRGARKPRAARPVTSPVRERIVRMSVIEPRISSTHYQCDWPAASSFRDASASRAGLFAIRPKTALVHRPVPVLIN